ncbi:undecaprenyl-phosphate glucose phosphotransferase [Orrella sp. JC864]|uniref:undecaprenyl-phosphate glucose phosphotransferase n=1 Tax=Orrella sp. JC864 TaxID=3120298 RepID=UPI00300AEBB7
MFLPDKPSHSQSLFLAVSGAVTALLCAGVLRWRMAAHGLQGDGYLDLAPVLVGLGTFVVFASFGLLISARSVLWMMSRAAIRWLRVLFLAMAALFFLPEHTADPGALRLVLAQWSAIVLPAVLLALALLRRWIHMVNNTPGNLRHAVFLGLGPEALKLAMRVDRSPILGIRVHGYYADRPIEKVAEGLYVPPYLGQYSDALGAMEADQYDIIFVGLGIEQSGAHAQALMNRVYDSTASIYFMPESPLLGEFTVNSADIAGVSLLALHETKMLGLSKNVKRAMDLALGSIALVLAAPVMLLAALAVRLDSPGPVIFRQRRYGEGGVPITVYKFRSMRVQQPGSEQGVLRQARQRDDRVTRVGRILRKTSIDELPQLFNVLQGSMSLVGPRPHAAEHNELYRKQIRGYMLRHTVKPGITGWAQVHGLRGETETPEKMQQRVAYDRYYITNWSVWLDIKILLRTVLMVLWDRNAY